MLQNDCLVTTRLFDEGSLDTRETRVAKREFNNPMDKHAVKVVKDDETVGHLPREFSRIAWYFLAHSGEISVEVIGRR